MYDRKSQHESQQQADELKRIPNAWMQYMRAGAFEEAWKLSDKVLAAGVNRDPQLPRHYQCVWDGSPLEGKQVFVRCYHGLGDTIQFIRYIPQLKQLAKAVIVWAQEPLLDLLKTIPEIDQLLALHDGKPDVNYDVDLEIMELPFIFRTTPDTIPSRIPYLLTEPLKLSEEHKFNVGIVWQSGNWNQARCIPFSALAPLATLKNINLYILQANSEDAGWQEGFGINPGEFNLYNYARVIRGLDLMISADSMPAHLAGAMNVPVWTILHNQSDWRWMEKREDSPWYPSMRLFRQQENESWESVIEQVALELQKLATPIQSTSV
jgi:hypothetical protein